MATHVEQGTYAPTREKQVFGRDGVVVYALTTGADGTQLSGTGDVIVISSAEAGWINVSTVNAADKAATVKTHRILAGIPRDIGGVMKGMWVSFFAEA